MLLQLLAFLLVCWLSACQQVHGLCDCLSAGTIEQHAVCTGVMLQVLFSATGCCLTAGATLAGLATPF